LGVLIVSSPPPSTSDYDKWILYRSATKTGSFNAINGATGQAVTDLTYFDPDGTATSWYKISYLDESEEDESALSNPFQGLSNTYTTVTKVASILGMSTRSDSTSPSVQQISEFIARAEDTIDEETGHAWRLRRNETASANDQDSKYEYYDIPRNYEWRQGIPIYLNNRKIRAFDADSGDVFEIWDGSSWEDWISGKTEGRAEDWWADYEQGVLFLRHRFAITGPRMLRLKYRYGETHVNKSIEDAATKMAAIDVILSDPRNVALPEGDSALTQSQLISKFEEQIKKALMKFKEFKVMRARL
jgi:hypothetical protein